MNLVKTIRRWPRTFAASLIAGMFVALWVNALGGDGHAVSDIKSDEQVILFPVPAHRLEDGRWQATLHGWVFEPEPDSIWRNHVIGELRDALDLEPQAEDSEILAQRVGWFIVDNERGKSITARISPEFQNYPLGESGSAGHFSRTVTFRTTEMMFGFYEVASRDRRFFRGLISLIEPGGRIVVSDIDDTIKQSYVRDKKKLLRATFLEPFEAVPGVAEAYRQWARQRAHFVYLSNGPWQLYPPLESFMKDERFPPGVFELQDFRLKDSSVMNLFSDPVVAKVTRLEKYFAAYPKARFALIGDSGEKDPEIYGQIARNHPDQVERIFIRNVTGEPTAAERYTEAFKDVPIIKWKIFDDAEALMRWKFAE